MTIEPPIKSDPRRQGAALVELTIVFLLLIVIVFGCVDFGRFATTYIAVTNAAREGANTGSSNPVTPGTQEIWRSQIQLAVEDELSGIPGFTSDKLTVSEPTIVSDEDLSRVRVQVAYPFETVVPWLILPDRVVITRAAEMPIVL